MIWNEKEMTEGDCLAGGEAIPLAFIVAVVFSGMKMSSGTMPYCANHCVLCMKIAALIAVDCFRNV